MTAKYALGRFYWFGSPDATGGRSTNSVPEDDYQALLWFGRAAEENYPDAQFDLAYMMEEGLELPNPQPDIAARYYRIAARGGDENAENELAEWLLTSRLQSQPANGRDEAIDLLKRALSQGSARVALHLANIYRDGLLGQTKQPQLAMQYAYRAMALSVQADPTKTNGNPFYEIAAGILLAEMAVSGEADDVNGHPLLTKEETDRLQRFYGTIDSDTHKVKVRMLRIPLYCGTSYRVDSLWVWDWGRNESPTEPQFRSLERRNYCFANDVLRRTLAASFDTARKNKVAFADLIDQQIRTAKAQSAAVGQQRR